MHIENANGSVAPIHYMQKRNSRKTFTFSTQFNFCGNNNNRNKIIFITTDANIEQVY